jgi:hypothetical protein
MTQGSVNRHARQGTPTVPLTYVWPSVEMEHINKKDIRNAFQKNNVGNIILDM